MSGSDLIEENWWAQRDETQYEKNEIKKYNNWWGTKKKNQ